MGSDGGSGDHACLFDGYTIERTAVLRRYSREEEEKMAQQKELRFVKAYRDQEALRNSFMELARTLHSVFHGRGGSDRGQCLRQPDAVLEGWYGKTLYPAGDCDDGGGLPESGTDPEADGVCGSRFWRADRWNVFVCQ